MAGRDPLVSMYPLGIIDEGLASPTVSVEHRGLRLLLVFGETDFTGQGDLEQFRILPGSERLEPGVLRLLVPKADTYLGLARAALRIRNTADLSDPALEDVRAAAAMLREIGGPGRGLPPQFYEQIAGSYRGLIESGEPHPNKALARIYTVTPSAASRWVKEARRRGLIPEGGEQDAS